MSEVTIEMHELGFARLPSELEGMRILQISDVHTSRWSRERERAAARAIRGIRADLVLLTGDYVNHARYWGRLCEWLVDVLPDVPRFAVPGNWDYKADFALEGMHSAMERIGVEVLTNRSCWVPRASGGLRVVGIDDVRLGALDLDRAFEEVRNGDFVVVACHSPDLLLHLDAEYYDFLVSGHTHGGQLRVPGYGAVFTSTRLGRHYDFGMYEPEAGRYVYISRGIGEGHIPFRILCPPELAIFELRRILKHSS